VTITYNPRTDTVRLNGKKLHLRPQLKTFLMLLWPTGTVAQHDLIEALWPDPDWQPLSTTSHIRVLGHWLNEIVREAGWCLKFYQASGIRKVSIIKESTNV